MKQKIERFLAARRVRHGGGAVALLALVLALFYLVNITVLGLANHFSWYFYTTPQYDLTVSGAADDLLADIPTHSGKVKIVFCNLEENVAKDNQLDYVYQTAKDMAARYPDLIDLSFVNLWLEPGRVAPYRVGEDGTENTLSTSTVIIDYNGEFVLNSASAFYTLDDQNYVTAYNGEEIFVANILWVTAPEHPVAYFTANHGEEIPAYLYRQLVSAGYAVERIDLSSVAAIPEDAGLVVISAPVYDFQKSAVDSSYVGELTKLATYLEAGGQMYVSLHPDHTERLPRLSAFLADYGVGVVPGVLVDRETALPGSGGYTLMTRYADTEGGRTLSLTAAGQRTLLSYAAPLALSVTEKATTEILLQAESSASLLLDGETKDGGEAPLLALATLPTGGRLLVCGSPYLADATAMVGSYYGNKEVVYATLRMLGASRVPSGIPAVMIDRSAMENLTLGEADLYTVTAVAILPAAILLAGVIVYRRRKNQ